MFKFVKRQFEVVSKIYASPSAVAQSPFFVAQSPFFVAQSEARGPSALAHLGMTSRDAVPNEVKDASLSLGMTK
jgi:hypothetical protein